MVSTLPSFQPQPYCSFSLNLVSSPRPACVKRQDTVIRKMNWRSGIYLCLFASSAGPRARQIMDDPLLSKPRWNGDKWPGVGARRNRAVLEKHSDGGGSVALSFITGTTEGALEAIY